MARDLSIGGAKCKTARRLATERAAEMLIFGRPSTGAADDFAKATDIARAMVMRYGMHEKLGLVAWEEERRNFLAGTPPLPPSERRYSEQTAREIDDAVRETVNRAFEAASGILARGRAVLERGAKQLLEKETLMEDDLQDLRNELTATLGAPRAPALLRAAEA